MAYIPLHHKYRPQTFADLVGQEAIATTLTNALRLQKIAPAYLFTGPRGTGKTSSARILAKSLNCIVSPVPTAQPCGKCDVCRAIALGAALDIIEIDAASNTGVDNIREIIERAQYAPVQCRYKVYIIDECHMLTTAAFNSLLKTLEEPPDRVVFVLATTDPQRVLPTIISRCQRFDYRRIPVDAMVKHLTYIAGIEQIEIAAASVKLVAQIAQGGLRDAESLLDRLSLLDGEITPDRVYDAIGSVPEQDLLEILQAISKSDPESLLDLVRNILERGKEPLIVLQNLAGCYRDLLIAKTAPKRPDLVALTAETWLELGKIAQTWQVSWILAGQKHLKDSEVQLKHTTQPQLWLEIAILGLLSVSIQPASAPLPVGVPSSSRSTPQPSTPPEIIQHQSSIATPPPAAQLAPPVQINTLDLVSTWEQVLQQLLPASRDLFKPFGKLIAVSEEQAVVAMKSSTMQTIASGKVPELAKVFSQMFNRSIAVKLEVMGKSQVQPSSTAPAPTAIPLPLKSIPQSGGYANEPPPNHPSLSITDTSISAPPAREDLSSTKDLEDRGESNTQSSLQPIAELLPALGLSPPQSISLLPTPPAEIDPFELDPPTDFAEPPDSVDLARAENTKVFEPEEPEIEPLLQVATDHVVKLFNGEIIDQTHQLFDQIVGT
jgi:DNA polymerase III subunit gamma/tau